MTTLVAFHSFRPGVGRSSLAANVAALLALNGKRVGAVDFGDEAGGIPALFGIEAARFAQRVADYFWGRIPIEEIAIDVTGRLFPLSGAGRLVVAPRVLWREWLAPPAPTALDQGVFKDALRHMTERLELDWLLIEVGAGLREETLLSVASADLLIELARRDAQDLQATAVMVGLAERLGARRILLVVSQAPATASPLQLRREFEAAYRLPVATVLPLAPELAHPQGNELLALTQPDHPWSVAVRELAALLGRAERSSQRAAPG
ncbi:MAG: hypothetical protein RMM58_08605 [Chloroflexota bacterium]|nr:hypothetical protein [Dehalococcoidia bacterium]MDW8253925.1 hypothetical protein [Chloroflexota bacterium]